MYEAHFKNFLHVLDLHVLNEVDAVPMCVVDLQLSELKF